MRNSRLLLLIGLALSASRVVLADTIFTTQGARVNGTIVRVAKDAVYIKAGPGETSVPLNQVARIDMPTPADYRTGLAALAKGKHTDAIISFKVLATKYAGLPLLWALDSMSKLADAYIATGDADSARATLENLRKAYPKTSEAENLDIKLARVHTLAKDYTKAVESATPVLNRLMAKPFLSAAEEALVTDGLLVIGDCHLANGKKQEALDAYLKMLALYLVEPSRAAEVQYKVGKLFEELGNWQRAKTYYAGLLKESPEAGFADDVKKRLDAIQQAHPE